MQYLWIARHLRRRKAQLYKGSNTIGEKAVVNLVDVGKVVHRGIVCLLRRQARVLGYTVGIVQPNLVHEDAVEPDRPEIRCLLNRPQILSVAVPQRKDRS